MEKYLSGPVQWGAVLNNMVGLILFNRLAKLVCVAQQQPAEVRRHNQLRTTVVQFSVEFCIDFHMVDCWIRLLFGLVGEKVGCVCCCWGFPN